MKINGKKMLSMLLAGAMLLLAAPSVSAAASNYSVQVSGNKINFVRSGKVVSSYNATNTNLVVTSDSSREILVQFHSAQGGNHSVTLGRQNELLISGSFDSLAIRNNLSNTVNVAIAKGSHTPKVLHYGRNGLTISGKVDLLSLYDASTAVITTSGSVGHAQLRAAGAHLNAGGNVSVLEMVDSARASGNGVARLDPIYRNASSKEWGTNKDSSYSELNLHIDPIYADEGEQLWDVEGELIEAITAFNRSGKRVSGDISFDANGSTTLSRTHSYRFTFHPDDHSYKSTSGSIKIIVEESKVVPTVTRGSQPVYLSIGTINSNYFNGMQLQALNNELNSAVRATDSQGRGVIGTVRWANAGEYVGVGGGSYTFTFYPNDSSFAETAATIRVNLTSIPVIGDPGIGHGVSMDPPAIGSGAVPNIGVPVIGGGVVPVIGG